jgi:dipeptidyl aminopeptidase/acylaminoacyl peptidase
MRALRVACRASLVAFAAAIVAAGFSASAHATLVFERNVYKPSVWVARDDGGGAHRLAKGSLPRLSPDGQTVAYSLTRPGGAYVSQLVVKPVAGGAARTLANDWRGAWSTFAWSPDSRFIATTVGPERGAQQLLLIEVASGATRAIATGYFYGVSFSPDGSTLVYGRAASEAYPQPSDIYSAPVEGGVPRAITSDQRSLYPLWGPRDRIVFVKLLGAHRRRYQPKNELFLMNPDGTGVRRLTYTHVGQLLQGLLPTQFSASGRRLLCEFVGQDTSYAVEVNAITGAHRAVHGGRRRNFVGSALSADGKTVLGFTDGVEPGPKHDVATIPYRGKRVHVLVRNALFPDWSR